MNMIQTKHDAFTGLNQTNRRQTNQGGYNDMPMQSQDLNLFNMQMDAQPVHQSPTLNTQAYNPDISHLNMGNSYGVNNNIQ